MKIVNWIEQDDGSFAWVIGECALATVHQLDGVWRTSWHGQRGRTLWSSVEFPSAHDACLASEKYWPSSDEYFDGWFESRNGGYFRKFGTKRVYVRKAADGWYAVQTDGSFSAKKGRCPGSRRLWRPVLPYNAKAIPRKMQIRS